MLTPAAAHSPPHLGSFIPRLLLELSAARDAGGATRVLQGVMLFVDIAESTSLTDRISAQGPDGAERLRDFLSLYFGALIDTVAAHGGEVVRIDGDAAIALWSERGPTPAHLLAAHAASALQRWAPVWPVDPPEPLRHRIVLAAGPFATCVLSGPGRRRFLLLAGPPLVTIGRIQRNGTLGDVILDDGMARLLAPVAATAPVAPAGPGALPAARLIDLPHAPPYTAALSPMFHTRSELDIEAFLPRVVLERDASGLADSMAEFRIASVVTARLAEPDLRAGDAEVQAAFGIVAAAADAMDLEVFDVVADEKGVLAKIACGLPPYGAEGTALRAVEIARRVRDGLADRGGRYSVGVATGRIFCGDVGNAIRREYVLSGAAMSYAARLMEAADRRVLCDADTVEAAGARFAFTPGTPMAIRGRAEKLLVHELIGARTAARTPRHAAPLEGRGPELAALIARVQALRAGEGGLVAVEAEPGGGKSRLLTELAASARSSGCTVIDAAANPIESATAYFVFRPVLQLLLAPAGETAPLRDQLREALAGTNLLPRAALIEDVMPLGIEDPGLAAQVRGAARRHGVEDIMVALMRARAQRAPLLLLIDDLQWIDALSADLLLAAGRRVPKMLTVAASRPPDPEAAPHGARVLARAERTLALQRLDPDATTRLVCGLLGVRAVPRRLAEFVHSRSEGLPIHAEQLVLALRDQKLVVVEDGRAAVTTPDLATESVPPRLREIIVGRIDRMRQADQLAAKVASVIGRSFDLAMLAAIHPMPVPLQPVQESAARLAAAGILAPSGAGYAFRHVLMQEATYDLLSYAQRRGLHRAAAEVIEAKRAEAPRSDETELAHHWEHAGEPVKAWQYRLRAASAALRRYANDDALMHAERADRLAGRAHLSLDLEQSARLAFMRGEAYHALSRFPEAEAQFRASLERRGIGQPPTRAHLLLSVIGQISLQFLHRVRIVRKLTADHEQERAKLSAHIHTRFAEHAYFMRDSLALVHGSLTALNRAESVESYPEMIEGYGGLAIGLGTAGLHPLARFYRDRSIAVAGSFGEVPDQAFARLLAGVYSFQAGDWAATRAYCDEGVALCERLGDRFREQSCHVIASFCAIATGDYDGAEAGLAAFGPEAEAVDNAPVRAWILAGSSVLDLLRGRSPERTLARMQLARDASLHRAEHLLCDGLEAAALLQGGDAAAAAQVAGRALADMQDSVCTMGIAMWSVCAVAEVLVALAARGGDLGRAEAACRAVRSYAAQTRIARPRARLLLGRVAQVRGRPRAAETHWRGGLASAERLGMPLEQAMCRLALAGSGVGAAQAGETMRALGADPWRFAAAGSSGSC